MRYWVLRLTFMWWCVSLDDVFEECTCVDDENENDKDSFMWHLMTARKRQERQLWSDSRWSEKLLFLLRRQKGEWMSERMSRCCCPVDERDVAFQGQEVLSCLFPLTTTHTRWQISRRTQNRCWSVSTWLSMCCSPNFDNVRERQQLSLSFCLSFDLQKVSLAYRKAM